jgi:hypothetical protein
MKQVNLVNIFNLGDGIFIMNYLHQISEYLIENDIHVTYYCNPLYKRQLEEFVVSCKGLVCTEPLDSAPVDAIDTWIQLSFPIFNKYPFNDFLVNHLNRIGKKIQLPKIRTLFYNDSDLDARYERMPDSCRNVDILFINAAPQSDQYEYKKSDWDALAHELVGAGYKLVSTSLIRGVESTIRHSMTVKDIAAIAGYAKYIVGVNSGPVAACLNDKAIRSVQRWFLFDNNMKYKYPTIQMCSSLDEVRLRLLPQKIENAESAAACVPTTCQE